MKVVFIVPTGIGAEIGGHCGDATPAAKLIASVCDKLIVHPNVVNAADINDMTDNMLYVEGSILDMFLEGSIGLEEVYSNRILLVTNSPVSPDTVNAVSAARATIGADIEILELKTPIKMSASMSDGRASGVVYGTDEAVKQIKESGYNPDVVVVTTPIEVNETNVLNYLQTDGGTNIWGGVEAKLSKLMSEKLLKPVIHSPLEDPKGVFQLFREVVDPRKSAELVSTCYLHCCFKGAHKAPRISLEEDALRSTKIDFLVSPIHVFGRPHRACVKAGIPIIVVEENKTILTDPMDWNVIIAKNYLEVAGIISAKKAGIAISSIKRPLERTKVIK